MRVDILPDVRQFAISNGNGEDPMVLERLIRGFDSPRSEADDQNPVSLRYELGGLWVRSFHRFVSLLQHIRQSRVPAVRAGQRPVLARNDPLNIFGRQRQQTLLIAAADGRSLLYTKDTDGVVNIWSQPIAGGTPRQITHFKSDFIFAFDLSRDGKKLVMEWGHETSDVVLIRDVR